MKRREWIGIAVAPLWAPTCLLLAEAFRVRPDPILDRLGPLQVAGMIAFVGIVSAYVAMLVVGIPIHLLLKRRRWTSLLPYVLSAFAAGIVLRCGAIFVTWLMFARDEGLGGDAVIRAFLRAVTEQPTVLLTAGALAALIGGTFWLLARPDIRLGDAWVAAGAARGTHRP